MHIKWNIAFTSQWDIFVNLTVSSGQGSSGHIAAGHGSTMISSHTFGQPSDGVGVVSSEVQSQPAGISVNKME